MTANKPITLFLFLFFLLFTGAAIGGETAGAKTGGHQLLLGYGTSHPGWGDTTERVQTLDIILRQTHLFETKKEGWLRGSHEFWIETPVSILISDSDAQDSHDFGIVGLNFLFAWVFPKTRVGNPYFMAGGGPVYVLADIEGVGSDLCGNYQAGLGLRMNLFKSRPVNLEVRYHHISNLGLKAPNIALNSTKFVIGTSLPF